MKLYAISAKEWNEDMSEMGRQIINKDSQTVSQRDRQIDRQNNSIDVAKLLMSLVVVAIHTNPLANLNNEDAIILFDKFVNIAVPFFFIASGYFLAKKIIMPICNENVRVIKKYLAKILKMYIFWMLLYTPLEIYHFIKSGTPIIKELMLYARGLFFVGQQYNSWQLWYLLSVIYSLCFLIVLSRIRKIKIVDLIVLS